MDAVHTSIWEGVGVQLDLSEHDAHPTAEDTLALCAGKLCILWTHYLARRVDTLSG